MSLETIRDPQPVMTQTLAPGRLQRLRGVYEAMAGDLGSALSDLLRHPVDVTLAGIDQLAYGRFVAGLARPTCLAIVKAGPWEDRLMLDIEPSILYPMIDRLLGGGQEDQPPPGRPLSDLERPLAVRIARVMLGCLRRAWKNVLDADMTLDVLQVENDARRCRLLPKDEMVAVAAVQLRIGNLQGMVRLSMPCRAIQTADSTHFPGANPFEDGVSVEVTLATASITTDELSSLQVGDIIATDSAVGSPAVVSVDGQPKFLAQPGVCEGRKAVRIVESL